VPDEDPQLRARRPAHPVAPRPRAPEGVELLESADGIRDEWDELADRTGASPFLRPGWIEPWQEAFGSGKPAYLTLRRDGRLAGVMPLQARRGTLVSTSNWHTPLYGPVVEDERTAAELAVALLARAGRRADLWFLDPDAPGYRQTLRAAEEAGYGVIARQVARSPYIELSGSFDDYLAGLERKFRKDLARRLRRIEEAGDVEFAFEDGTERLDELLTDGFRLEGSGWKLEQGSAIVSNPKHERFYREIAAWAAERGWLRLAFLRLDGEPIAFDLCIEEGGAMYVPKGGFDVEHRKLGPGQLLTRAGIAYAYERGLRSYELLGQQDEYKRQWTSAVRERVRVQAFPRRPAGSATYLAWRYGRPLAQAALRRRRGAEEQ
jgi:CelD/BcsL family acetyltransferase involved in cellulose biosynthesis